jgi:dihydroorotase
VHCEDETTIKKNLEKYKAEFEKIFLLQRTILSEVKRLLYLQKLKAKRNRSALACFHLSTAKEMDLFTNKIPLEEKNYCRSLYSPSLVYQ